MSETRTEKMKFVTQITQMKTPTITKLDTATALEVTSLREAVAHHNETAALYASNAAWQDDVINDARQAIADAEETLHKSKSKRDYWARKSATEQAVGEDAAHALERAVERLNAATAAANC